MTNENELVTEEMLEYLDDLRESGVVNMFGAAPYLEEEFGLDRREARGAYSAHPLDEDLLREARGRLSETESQKHERRMKWDSIG